MFGNPWQRGFRRLAKERDQALDVIDSATREQAASMRNKKLRRGS